MEILGSHGFPTGITPEGPARSYEIETISIVSLLNGLNFMLRPSRNNRLLRIQRAATGDSRR